MNNLICRNCQESFNRGEKRPLLLPCGDTLCEKCFNLMTEPQENRIICPFDNEILDLPSRRIENK